MATHQLSLQAKIMQGVLAGCFLVVVRLLPGSVVAQQPTLPCEERLQQGQARLELVAIGREQGEIVAGDALAKLRIITAALEAQIKKLEAENVELKAKVSHAETATVKSSTGEEDK